jgi:hypothetical protein
MEIVRLDREAAACAVVDLSRVEREATDEDRAAYLACVDTALDPRQRARVADPGKAHLRQESILAVHWHPEFVPMDLVMERVRAMYPNSGQELIIPTQHNELLTLGGYAGVEVDCYSRGFNRKVQLLLHFRADKVAAGADKLRSMLDHTFTYRSSQLGEFLDSLVDDGLAGRRDEAAANTAAGEDLVGFCRVFAAKLRTLLEENWADTPRAMAKNKLVRDFFDTLRPRFGDRVVDKAQVFLKEVKRLVKENFSLRHFYRASEFIEETRGLGGGVVIPHPEQFWPILLADYDVDGIEVWNPQSREYTEFLIHVLNRHNETRRTKRPLLAFMGDDCHMGEKVKDPRTQDPEKAGREIGLQPAWDDMAIRKSLILCNMSRENAIEEYVARLS